ncbi:family 10 glycosylhydrolase [Nostoc sp.]|uniref:family 10 glycosylhydrolase n=1 Tax=Nostoc sp. TaxID=1180 RepID=UPI002FFADCA9
MSRQDKKPNGCGCSNIPFSIIIVILGGGYWWFSQKGNLDISNLLPKIQQIAISILNPTPTTSSTPTSSLSSTSSFPPNNKQAPVKTITLEKTLLPPTPWEKKVIRGIYLSRYQVTNNADEETIRQRVRYYHSQGINTIIHGVWGNGCTMYNSDVMQQTLGYRSCPNQFQERWLDWLIDEAHKQGMQVHAYFEKGIKIDKNSPIYDLAISRKWIVPGVDKTYVGIDHYVLDVEIPEVASFFRNILVEFVQKYPKIDAVQWDDYLGYYAELPGKIDRTAKLTSFVQQIRTAMKQANFSVSFDICHHNPYWAKRYFAADWQKWNVDRVFIQAYNEANFKEELNYAKNYAGIAITDHQLHRLKELVDNDAIKSILIFPISGKPEETASTLKSLTQNNN